MMIITWLKLCSCLNDDYDIYDFETEILKVKRINIEKLPK